MGIFSRLERPTVQAQAWGPLDDRWYQPFPVDTSTYAGFPIGPDTVMRVSTVFACVSLKSETLGSLPCHLYRRLENGGRERAKEHRLYRTVRFQPNAQHTAMDFFSSGETRVNLRGLAIAEIQQRRDRVDLVPIRPADIIRVEQLDTYRVRFEVKDPKTHRPRTLLQDEVLFVRDLMEDGFAAVARASLAREAIAVAAAGEAYVGGFFRNDATGRLAITHPGSLTEEKRKEFRQMIQENYAGWANRSKFMFLTNGVTAAELGKHDDAGFIIDPRNFQVADIARFFGRIPLFMIGLEEKSTTWGTGVEQQKQGWIDFGMLPDIVRWEQAMNRDLLLPEEQEEYFFEFNLDGLLRGDAKSRAETQEIRRRNGVISPNEWRLADNMNPREDGGGDEYLDTPTGAAPNPSPIPPTPPAKDGQAQKIPAPLLADAVHRIANREVDDVSRRLARASDPEKWTAWLVKYYAAHRDYVVKVLTPLAEAYGFERWVTEEAAVRIERTADGLTAAAAPAFLTSRREQVSTLLEETFTAGAAARVG